ncbi:MAG: deoxyribodipyrimidine photo-lyase [Ignavibacteria bacterium]|nr:deoxyribodipyrimidine photo-lyase [Ignavibacteria bacterium]
MVKIFWFRKDLRLDDNRALSEFIKGIKSDDKFLFIYIKNNNSFRFFGEKRIQFLNECLLDLKNKLNEKGFNLHIFNGNSLSVFNQIIDADSIVYANKQYEPYCIERDSKISDFLISKSSELKLYADSTVFEPNKMFKADGTPYTIFTPFKNKFFTLLNDTLLRESKLNFKNINPLAEQKFKEALNFEIKSADLSGFSGGRTSALKSLSAFCRKGIEEYNSQRDYPSADSTSKLSPHIHFGTVSVRECFSAAFKKLNGSGKKSEILTWINELIWREFYYHITFNFPHVINGSFKKVYDKLNWTDNDALFNKWCEGKTGFPIVDAGMRQLNTEGWMHNRLRMITAMFLTKDLFINWKKGEKYFAGNLIDLDFASNNGGWQWSASTGCDAQPYFRIFNPYLQSEKFDKYGDYIRKYVPELKDVPPKYIHKPDEMTADLQKKYSVIIGKDYPYPIVEHKTAKEFSLSKFKLIHGK